MDHFHLFDQRFLGLLLFPLKYNTIFSNIFYDFRGTILISPAAAPILGKSNRKTAVNLQILVTAAMVTYERLESKLK